MSAQFIKLSALLTMISLVSACAEHHVTPIDNSAFENACIDEIKFRLALPTSFVLQDIEHRSAYFDIEISTMRDELEMLQSQKEASADDGGLSNSDILRQEIKIERASGHQRGVEFVAIVKYSAENADRHAISVSSVCKFVSYDGHFTDTDKRNVLVDNITQLQWIKNQIPH